MTPIELPLSLPAAAALDPVLASQLQWQWSAFEGLDIVALQSIYRLRAAVFVVEQDCAYQDIDGFDEHAWHLMAWLPGEPRQLAAYLRVVLPGHKYAEPSIGRVVTDLSCRGRQLGRALVALGIEQTVRQYPQAAIRISAQQHLNQFYASLGFECCSPSYLEDGIPHIEMLRPINTPMSASGL